MIAECLLFEWTAMYKFLTKRFTGIKPDISLFQYRQRYWVLYNNYFYYYISVINFFSEGFEAPRFFQFCRGGKQGFPKFCVFREYFHCSSLISALIHYLSRVFKRQRFWLFYGCFFFENFSENSGCNSLFYYG